MRSRRNASVIVASAGVVAFMVFAYLPGAVAAPGSPDSASGTTSAWAFGHVQTVTVGPLLTADHWEYEASLAIGFTDVMNETNTTASGSPPTFALSAYGTEGVRLTLEFCYPGCRAPQQFANLSMQAWQTTSAWGNFTSNATVFENSTPARAIGLLDASSSTRSNLTIATFSATKSSVLAPTVERSEYLSAATVSRSSVTFSPALGLIPINVTGLDPATAAWNSSSTYVAHGTVTSSYYWAFHGPVVGNLTSGGPVTSTSSFSPTGTLSVSGSFASTAGVLLDGLKTSIPALRLNLSGPFSAEDGVLLVPAPADVFGTAAQPWGADQASAALVQPYAIDYDPAAGHFGLIASSRAYQVTSANPADIDGPGSSTASNSPVAASVATMDPVGSTIVQGEPEAVGSANSNSQCLTAGLGCSGGLSSPRALLATVGAALVVGGAAAVIVAVAVADRRRLPPPTYPNSPLYPPGATFAPSRAGPGGPSSPPSEDDPLDNLW